ncbi:conserved hypothetical protein [Trichinella spiralis]|uniref:hypothetical protein n=1 Tax=Trichinella spiralis TaxID=6334 RepID=UPI0001EFDE93|nr:conserved hypothetical protein [Trichinella spiralis]
MTLVRIFGAVISKSGRYRPLVCGGRGEFQKHMSLKGAIVRNSLGNTAFEESTSKYRGTYSMLVKNYDVL